VSLVNAYFHVASCSLQCPPQRPSYLDCITATRGYDFGEGQGQSKLALPLSRRCKTLPSGRLNFDTSLAGWPAIANAIGIVDVATWLVCDPPRTLYFNVRGALL
jgi:hypothetical protein